MEKETLAEGKRDRDRERGSFVERWLCMYRRSSRHQQGPLHRRNLITSPAKGARITGCWLLSAPVSAPHGGEGSREAVASFLTRQCPLAHKS